MFKQIKEDVDSYFARDPAARNRMEIFLCYPGLHAIILYRLANKLWLNKFFLTARMISNLARFFTGIEIHPGAKIGKYLFIDHGMGVVIGETATIGNNVTIYHGVTLGGTSWNKGIRHPQVKDNVVIGSGAQILGPITIGEGAKIGANAVVVKEVGAHETMVGVPARHVRDKNLEHESGFSAYGSTDQVDPTKQDIINLKEQLEKLQKKVKKLEKE